MKPLLELAGQDHPYPAERFAGRGLVVCAGGTQLFTCAWVLVWVLRRELGCELPIEVWHLGPDELGPPESALLAELDVACVDAAALRERVPARALGGWELKSYALVNCRFREVLLLDADNVPVRDPADLFESAQFEATGALFWPDSSWLARDSPIWPLCGLEPQTVPAWESGQLALDKARAWAPLQLVRWMNDHSEVFYRHLHGDKDTFNLAWRMLELPYAMPARGPRPMQWGLLQHDFDGNPLFQHRMLSKWSLERPNEVGRWFEHGEACLAALEYLASRWPGSRGDPAHAAVVVALREAVASGRVTEADAEQAIATLAAAYAVPAQTLGS